MLYGRHQYASGLSAQQDQSEINRQSANYSSIKSCFDVFINILLSRSALPRRNLSYSRNELHLVKVGNYSGRGGQAVDDFSLTNPTILPMAPPKSAAPSLFWSKFVEATLRIIYHGIQMKKVTKASAPPARKRGERATVACYHCRSRRVGFMLLPNFIDGSSLNARTKREVLPARTASSTGRNANSRTPC